MSQPCAIYCRISQDREGAGLGVERQEEDCRALAERLGLTVIEVLSDNDISAYKRSSRKRREGYDQLLAGVKSGRFKAIVSWHTDRLHRSNLELEHFIEICRDVPTYTVRGGTLDLSTASGRLFARQLGSVARYQSEHMSEQIEARRKQRVFSGGNGGGPRPFGFDDGGLVIREDEAAEVREATRKIIGGASLGSVVRDLNARGVRTSRGSEWSLVNLRAVLMRPRNAGILVYKDREAGPAPWPAIVPELEWRQCRAVLADTTRRTTTTNRTSALGSGIYRCGVCGATMRIAFSGQNSRVRGYRCSAGAHVTQAAAPLDEYVLDRLAWFISLPRTRELFAKSYTEQRDGGRAQKDISAAEARLAELGEMFAAGEIDGRTLKSATEKLQQQITEAQQRIGATVARRPVNNVLKAALQNMEERPRDFIAAYPLEIQRGLLADVATVTVNPAMVRGGRFDPGRVVFKWKWDE